MTRLTRGLAATLIAAAVTACSGGPADDAGPGPDSAPRVVPVVLVHGLGGTPSSLADLERRVRAEGRPVVNVALAEQGTGPIETSVAAVAAAVTGTGAAEVDLVGHSLGGVIVRAYAVANPDVARNVVTLAAPHHGAGLADLAAELTPSRCGAACQQLRSGSPYLRALNDGDETPDEVSWTTLRTERDSAVTPIESAMLDGAVNVLVQDVCRDVAIDHLTITRDPLALGIVVLALRGELDDVPEPSECDAVRAVGAVEPVGRASPALA